MQFNDAFLYMVTLVTLTLAPGPLVLFLLLRATANDRIGALGFGLGVALGDIAVIAAICFGLGVWAQSASWFSSAAEVGLLLYFGWLAANLWNGGFNLVAEDGVGVGTGIFAAVAAGAATCIVTPSTYGLYSVILPKLVDISELRIPGFMAIAALTFASLGVCFLVVVLFAEPLRRLSRSPKMVVRINRVLSCLLIGSACWMTLI